MAQKNTNDHMQHHDETGVLLLLQVPRTNEKKELAAEQMFASLHGLLTIPLAEKGFFTPAKVRRERISMEIAVREKRIGFYVWVPNYLVSYVEEQIYAQYPMVQISIVDDYALDDSKHYPVMLNTEMKLNQSDVLPLKTFQSFEVDPLAAITATLAKFEEGEEAWIQLIMQPASSSWHKKSEKYQSDMKNGGGNGIGMGTFVKALWEPPEPSTGAAPKLADHEQIRVSASEEKSQKLAFECSVRIVYRGNVTQPVAQLRIQSIIASYKQFNTTYLNGFEPRRVSSDPTTFYLYQLRGHNKQGFNLNIEEIATLYHLPHTNVETPFILWATSQTAEPPANLPIVTAEPDPELSPIATTNFRGHNTAFGLRRIDRSRHLYIIGQTGVGKSGMLELLTISDIYSPYGFAVIDPHGDYAQNVLDRIPAERAQDVLYFNPADVDFPMAFNPMEVTDPKLKTHTASELIGVLKRMFESWGPRLEYILRYCLLALLDYPDATMLDITRMLTDKKFRNDVLKVVEDPVVRNFWQIEFASWNDKFAAEAVAPVLNKVGAFTANPLVRNIIGQPKSAFNIRQIMDERKILVVNLSRGLVGEDNAALLGALLVTKVQLAAMSRADIPADQRSPFYLYVDEFQNFATDSFATILSEARKYALNLTVANQYTAQMAPEVKDAVFGNVGSIIAFRMGADDGRVMMKYFEPRFLEYDLVHMHNRNFVITQTIGGEKVPAFSAVSLNLPPAEGSQTQAIIARSRATYASSRAFVEAYVGERYLDEGKKQALPAQSQPKAGKPPLSKPDKKRDNRDNRNDKNSRQDPGQPKAGKQERPEKAADSANTFEVSSPPEAAPAPVRRGGPEAAPAMPSYDPETLTRDQDSAEAKRPSTGAKNDSLKPKPTPGAKPPVASLAKAVIEAAFEGKPEPRIYTTDKAAGAAPDARAGSEATEKPGIGTRPVPAVGSEAAAEPAKPKRKRARRRRRKPAADGQQTPPSERQPRQTESDARPAPARRAAEPTKNVERTEKRPDTTGTFEGTGTLNLR